MILFVMDIIRHCTFHATSRCLKVTARAGHEAWSVAEGANLNIILDSDKDLNNLNISPEHLRDDELLPDPECLGDDVTHGVAQEVNILAVSRPSGHWHSVKQDLVTFCQALVPISSNPQTFKHEGRGALKTKVNKFLKDPLPFPGEHEMKDTGK